MSVDMRYAGTDYETNSPLEPANASGNRLARQFAVVPYRRKGVVIAVVPCFRKGEEMDSITYIPSDAGATADEFGNLVIRFR